MLRKIFIALELTVAAAFIVLGVYGYWRPIDGELEYRDGRSAGVSSKRGIVQWAITRYEEARLPDGAVQVEESRQPTAVEVLREFERMRPGRLFIEPGQPLRYGLQRWKENVPGTATWKRVRKNRDSTSIGWLGSRGTLSVCALTLPAWAFAGLFLLHPPVPFLWRRYRRLRRYERGLCPACGYDVTGTPGIRCSECGEQIAIRAMPAPVDRKDHDPAE